MRKELTLQIWMRTTNKYLIVSMPVEALGEKVSDMIQRFQLRKNDR
jgi:hypothetical protein